MYDVVQFLKIERPDLLFLQEVILNSEQLEILVSRYGYGCHVSLREGGSSGIATIFKKELKIVEIHIWEPGRLQFVKLESGMNFLNVYAPAGSNFKKERNHLFSETIFRNLKLKSNLPFLIGDFNCIILKKDTENYFENKYCKALADLVSIYNYTDVFNFLHPNETDFTFFRPNAAMSRLDRVYCPGHLIDHVKNIMHKPSLSDHKMVNFSIDSIYVQSNQTFQTYWKLNVSILEDKNFLANFEHKWNKLINEIDSFSLSSAWWEDFAKLQVKNFLIQFSKIRSYMRKGTKSFLFQMLDLALQQKDNEEVNYLRNRIKEIVNEEIQGYKIRCKSNEFIENEQIGLYHVNKEVKHGQKNCIDKLSCNFNNTEFIEHDPERIENHIISHFDNIFNNNDILQDQGSEFFFKNLSCLTIPERESIDSLITIEEVMESIDSFEPRKSPGLDGLPYEFYKKTKFLIAPVLVKIYNEQLESGVLLNSYGKGVTRLLKKVPGIPNASELRPITLLQCEYKMLSKIINKRIMLVNSSIFKSNQLCSQSDRSIFDGIFNILSTIDYINTRNLSGYIFSLDILKAYDRTRVQYVAKVMRKMKFPEKFIRWIIMLHQNNRTCFILNGKLSKELNVKISIRQGDPLAMILFLINIEPLLITLKLMLKGVSFPNFKQSDENYVDDCNIISCEEDDLFIVDRLFSEYEKCSGTSLNRNNKCKIMGLGRWTNRTDWVLQWPKSVDNLKVFGFIICQTVELSLDSNWKTLISNLKTSLLIWNRRFLQTLSQRTFILQTFVLSKMCYLTHILPLTYKIYLEILKLIKCFLWYGRIEKLDIEELYVPKSEGGLSICNIQAKSDSLRMKFLANNLKSNNRTSQHLKFWLGQEVVEFFPQIDRNEITNNISTPFSESNRIFLKEAATFLNFNWSDNSKLKTKKLYEIFNSTPPPHKIYKKRQMNWDLVWSRLNYKVINTQVRDVIFCIIHDIYPNNERLFRCNQVVSMRCKFCFNIVDNNIHRFVECSKVNSIFNYILFLMNQSLQMDVTENEENFLFLNFAKYNDHIDRTIVFVVSSYIQYVHEATKKSIDMNIANFCIFLKQKYTENEGMSIPSIQNVVF